MQLDEVVVVGRRPGPPLWRVQNGQNTLYIFGSLHPLPARFDWDPTAIEHVLTKAELFLWAPGVSASASNPITLIRVMRRFRKLKKIDGQQELNNLLPPPLQTSLAELLDQYSIAYRKVSRLKPLFAAEELQERVAKAAGFAKSDRISKHIRKLVRRNKVPTIDSVVEIEIDTALMALEKLPVTEQIDCLATTVAALRDDTTAALQRAYAWISGDAGLLQQFDYPNTEHSCADPFRLAPGLQEAIQQSESRWLNSAEQALREYRTSITILPIREVIHEDGLLARLLANGYKVPTASAG